MARDKILPEDLLQRTNLQQHNFMIDAINEVNERQGIVEDITATNTGDVAILKDELIALSNEHKDDLIALSNEHRDDFIVLSNEKLDKEAVDANLHFGEITLTREGTSVMASMDVLNPVNGLVTSISFTIPGATSAMAGVMPADDAAWIAEAEGRISALEGMSDVKALVGLSEDPTQAEITGAWMSETARAPMTGDLAQDVSNGKLWIFVDDRWVLHGVVVTVPVATTTSLGGVKDTALGAPANRWYCHVEADGRVALIGGDSLSTLLDTTIPAMQGELALKADKAEVDSELALKADKAGVNAELALKADKTVVALKADKTEVALKADKTDIPLVATEAEAIAGIDDTKFMSPKKAFNLVLQLLPPVDCTTLLTMYRNNTSITFIPLINAGYCTNLEFAIRECTNLERVGHIHAPYVANMEGMFRQCGKLTTLPTIDTSRVTNMYGMFYKCSSLTSVTFECADVRPYGTDMFASTPIASGNGYIFVPDSLVQAYRTAPGWSAHASIIFGHSDKANMVG